jgi:hypothetical protein
MVYLVALDDEFMGEGFAFDVFQMFYVTKSVLTEPHEALSLLAYFL